jgi:hypothetical protein
MPSADGTYERFHDRDLAVVILYLLRVSEARTNGELYNASKKYFRYFIGNSFIGRFIGTMVVLKNNGFIEFDGTIDQSLTREDQTLVISVMKENWGSEVSLLTKFVEFQSYVGVNLTESFNFLASGSKSLRVNPIWKHLDIQPNATEVFVLMPYQKPFTDIYDQNIKKVCDELGISCSVALEFKRSKAIMQEIWESIYAANVIIADCTGKNPNVFYELGIAHTLGKEVIIITQNADDVSFDIRHLRYIPYENTGDGIKRFESVLKDYIRESMPQQNVRE